MPLLADITVKKADGTTNVVFVAKQASSGDKNPATWSCDGASVYRSQRPSFSASAQFNGPRTARRVNAKINWPFTRLVDAVPVIVQRGQLDASVLVPLDLTDTEINEFVHQSCNILASALFKAMASEGYAAT
jgi:hypothetical protein